MLPTQDKEAQQIIRTFIVDYANTIINSFYSSYAKYTDPEAKAVELINVIEKLGYHKGLPSNIEEDELNGKNSNK